MRWEATDQFGNLYVGVSESSDVESLKPELLSMADELGLRASGDIKVTIDIPYGEINGPNPDQVSHVLQVSWLPNCDDPQKVRAEIADCLSETKIDVCLAE